MDYIQLLVLLLWKYYRSHRCENCLDKIAFDSSQELIILNDGETHGLRINHNDYPLQITQQMVEGRIVD